MAITDKIEAYIASNPKRPLLVWFHSNGEIDEAKRSIASMPGCAKCGHNVYEKDGELYEKYPLVYHEGTRFFLFHFYFKQLKAPYLQYAADLMHNTGLTVVYLANDYSRDEEPELNVSAFEEWDYNELP